MSKLNTSKTTWDLSPLLKSDNDPNIAKYRQAISKATDAFVTKWRGRKTYLEQPAALLEALNDLEALENLPGNGSEAYYFHLKTNLDSMDSKLKGKESQSDEFEREQATKMQFFWINVSNIPADLHKSFLDYPGLKPYLHQVERAFASAKYRLSEPEEKILMLMRSVSYGKWVDMTSSFLAKAERRVKGEDGKEELQTFEKLSSLISSKNKPVRDAAAGAMNDILRDLADVAENELNAVLEGKKITDQLRGCTRADEARHFGDDVESGVVDAMLDAVGGNNDLPRRFYDLKAKLLGVDKLAYHERNVEYGKVEKDYSFEDASELVYSVFTELDPEFGNIFAGFLSGGQIDVFPRKGKRGGAFCAGHHALTAPTYIMLNHTNKLRDVATLAHELGHGINNELMKQKQNSINCNTPMVTAEVASTFMEDFVLERLLKEADDETRLSLQVSQLGDAVSTIYRQVAFYRFEQKLHASFRDKGYLSKDDIGKLFRVEMEAYMGPSVEQSSGSENWWLFVSHFRSYFYVYSYASGLLISKAMQSHVRRDKAFVAKVKQFLSVGVSQSPREAFNDMDIDITDKAFWQAGLSEIGELLDDTEKLAKKIGKI